MFRSSPPPGSERSPYQILEPPLLNGSVDFSFWTVPISVHPDQSAADMRRYPCPSESPDQQRAPGLVGSALSESTQSTLVLAKLCRILPSHHRLYLAHLSLAYAPFEKSRQRSRRVSLCN